MANLSQLVGIIKSVPNAFLANAAVQIAEGFITEYAPTVTIEMVRKEYKKGRTIQEALGLAQPDIKTFLITIAQKVPWIFDDITFDVFLSWVGETNPRLVQDIMEDNELFLWAATSWSRGVEEIKTLAKSAKT